MLRSTRKALKLLKNYLEYTTVGECLQAVDFLCKNPFKIQSMKIANREYYKNYGTPAKLIENALNTAGIYFNQCL